MSKKNTKTKKEQPILKKEEKVKINTSLDDVLKVSFTKKDEKTGKRKYLAHVLKLEVLLFNNPFRGVAGCPYFI